MTPWNWKTFVGSAEAIKYAKRDLPGLDSIAARSHQRRVAVQAGASLGLYPKRLSELFEVVYCFEPSPDCFAAMAKNAPEPNIYRYQAVLGFDRGLVGLSRKRRDGKLNIHEGITHVAGEGIVPTLRLDDFALPVCDVLCLDVEGYELFALKGAVETIARCRPVLSIEVNKNCAFGGYSEDELRAFIMTLGYHRVDRLHSDDVFEPLERTA